MLTAEELTAQGIAAYQQNDLGSAAKLFVQALQIKDSHEMAVIVIDSVRARVDVRTGKVLEIIE